MSDASLTAESQELLRSAAALHGQLVRAASLARSNARCYVAFGVLTLLFAVSGLDVPNLAQGALLTAVGAAQLRAARRLRRGDLAAPGLLARNELVLMGGVLVYCALKLTVLRPASDGLSAQFGDLSGMGLDVSELTESMHTLVYTTFIVLSLLYQGGFARYFLRRRPLVERYVAEAPAWTRETVESLHD